MKLVKISEVLGGFISLLIGISGCLGVLLLLPLSDKFFSFIGADVMSLWKAGFAFASIGIPLPIIFLEWGFFWIRKSWGMGDTQGRYPIGNVWTKIARFFLPISVIFSIGLILVLFGLIAVEAVILGFGIFKDPEALSRPLIIWGLLLAFYAGVRILLWIFWRVAGKQSAGLYGLGMPKYTLIDGGVEIDLNYPFQIGTPGPSRFTIRFDELEEVRIFTYAETAAYLQYTVGPNIPLGVREFREVYQWRTGKIPRPTAHLSTAQGMFGRKVLLRGPELFYLFSFQTKDAGDLLEAFRRSQPLSALPTAPAA